MGISPFRRSASLMDNIGGYPHLPSSSKLSQSLEDKPLLPIPAGNPDPSNYKFLKAEQIGDFLLVKIQYPDCTNYEGQKILLFRGVTVAGLINQHNIDPHFCNNAKYHHPIVRFVPTDEGWEMAQRFARMETKIDG